MVLPAKEIPIESVIANPAQPRKSFPAEALSRLAESIAARGILQPIRVVWDEQRNKYLIIAGECRWRGAQIAGLPTVPCLVVEGQLDELEVLADQLTENLLRNALPPIQTARAIGKLKALSGLTAQALSAKVGIHVSTISRSEALLTLPENIQQLVDEGRIPGATAYEISKLPDAQSMQDLAQLVAAGQVSRDQAAKTVRATGKAKKATRPKESRFSQKLDGGVSLSISASKTLTIEMLSKAADAIRREIKKRQGNNTPVVPSSETAAIVAVTSAGGEQ